MKRDVRLRSFAEFQRVRRYGKTFTHRFIVLIVLPQEQPRIKIAVTAGRSIGNAVTRNRAKRRIRAILNEFIPLMKPGFNIIVIAREAINRVTYLELRIALRDLLISAQVLKDINEFTDNTVTGIGA